MIAVASSGFTDYQALGRRENAALKVTEAISAERRAEAVKRRQARDQAFRYDIQQLRMAPAMTGSEGQIGGAENTFHAFESVRGKVDETLTRVREGRPSVSRIPT